MEGGGFTDPVSVKLNNVVLENLQVKEGLVCKLVILLTPECEAE